MFSFLKTLPKKIWRHSGKYLEPVTWEMSLETMCVHISGHTSSSVKNSLQQIPSGCMIIRK